MEQAMRWTLLVLLAMSTVANAAPVPDAKKTLTTLSMSQKNAAVQRFVRSATDCLAGKVASDDRFADMQNNLGDLIVDAMPACLYPIHQMIDEYDGHFGAGAGQTFFMGPYLDLLPLVIIKWAREHR